MSDETKQPTVAAMRAAASVWARGTSRQPSTNDILGFAELIDRETKLPELIAERDRLTKLVERWREYQPWSYQQVASSFEVDALLARITPVRPD